MGVHGQRHTPAALPQEKVSNAHSTGGWMGAENINPTGTQSPDCPSCSRSLFTDKLTKKTLQ